MIAIISVQMGANGLKDATPRWISFGKIAKYIRSDP